jgi:hypothetical protein
MKLKLRLVFLVGFHIFISQCLPLKANAENIKGRIVSAADNQPIPFVCVRFSPANSVTFTTIDGWFEAPDNVSSLRFSHFGFESLTVSPKELKDVGTVIRMLPLQNRVSPFMDSLFKNTGLRLMKKVVEYRVHNDPEKYNSYRYTYLQNFTISSGIALKSKTVKSKETDTIRTLPVQTLTANPFFSLEILSLKKMLQPNHMNENLISAKYTGTVKKPYLSLANELQDFSVYDQFFTVLNKSYFSPVSQAGLKKYYYVITDTFTIGTNDSIFIIRFGPRRQKSVNTLQGEIFVNKHAYAVQVFTAKTKADDPAIHSISINQKFDLLTDEKWFPGEKLASVKFMLKKADKRDSVFWNITDPYNRIVAVNHTSFYQREINPPLKPEDFTRYSVALSPDLNKPFSESVPPEKLVSHAMIDSLARLSSDSTMEAGNLADKSKLIRFLAEGKIPVGYFDINYTNLFSYNLYEGIKIGLGAETNRRLSKYFTLGGYITYGLKDKAVHRGEWLDIYPKGYYDFRLYLGYRDMNMEFGEPEFLEKRSLLNPEYFRYLLIKNMYSTRRYSAGIELRPFQELNTYLFGDLSDNSARKNNLFLSQHTFSPFRLTRVGLQLRYSPGISFIKDPDILIENTPPESDWFFNVIRGLGIFGGEFHYTKFEFKGKFHFQPYRTGTTSVIIRAGFITEHAPLTELFNGYGSYVNTFSLIAPNSFTTMRQNEFGADAFTSLHIRHDMGTLFFPAGHRFNPNFVIAENIGFGKLDPYHSTQFGINDFRKGYYESGFEINNILRMEFLSWGVGVYYRYGPYALPFISDNFAYKFGFYFKL